MTEQRTVTDTRGPDYGRLTEAGFERSRARVGVPIRLPNPPHNFEVSRDGIRHFAYGYGDDNPLYCDDGHAAASRWGGIVAPPAFLYTMGEDASPRPTPPEHKEVLRGDPFAGLGSYQAVMGFEWWRPLQLGDRLKCLRAQVGVQDKRSDFGGRSAHVMHDFIYADQHDRLHAIRRGTWVNTERSASKERSKDRGDRHQLAEPYTPDQLAEIDAAYAAETRRGAEPRWFEDVEVGDEVDRKVKGPLTTTDVVVWHLGWGMQLTPPGSFRLAWKVRQKAPGLYPPNSLNVPDTVQRLHWEPERARELGLPTSYDYGGLREAWLCHLVTDWMGDDAWLWKLECQHRRFNFMGDASWLTGEVTDKRQVEGPDGVRSEVHLDIRVTNQRGVVTSPGSAVVLLPSREHGPVVLPHPPADSIEAMREHEIDRLRVAPAD